MPDEPSSSSTAADAFAREMQRLVDEARTEISSLSKGESVGEGGGVTSAQVTSLGEALGRVEKALAEQQETLKALGEIRSLLDRSKEVETAHQKLFDALHDELKGYKDAFLFDSLQKPFIKDLIALHDDMEGARKQAAEARDRVGTGTSDAEAAAAALGIAATNIENLSHLLVEILNRLDVVREEPSAGLVDKRIHRIMGTLPAEGDAQDGQIAEHLRPGFTWRGRPLRPEEVKVYRAGS